MINEPGGKRFILRQTIIAIIVSVAVISPILWMMLDRQPPFIIEHIEIIPQDAPQCQELEIKFTVKHARQGCSASRVYREFRDRTGRIAIYDPIRTARILPRDTTEFSRKMTPCGLDVGPAAYRGVGCYTCNFLQEWMDWPICVRTDWAPFNVVKGAPPDSN